MVKDIYKSFQTEVTSFDQGLSFGKKLTNIIASSNAKSQNSWIIGDQFHPLPLTYPLCVKFAQQRKLHDSSLYDPKKFHNFLNFPVEDLPWWVKKMIRRTQQVKSHREKIRCFPESPLNNRRINSSRRKHHRDKGWGQEISGIEIGFENRFTVRER